MDPWKAKGHFACTEDEDVISAENIQSWWGIGTYASTMNAVSQSKRKLQGETTPEIVEKFPVDRFELSKPWSEPEPIPPNIYNSAVIQLYSFKKDSTGTQKLKVCISNQEIKTLKNISWLFFKTRVCGQWSCGDAGYN